ncbi:MAG: hypothetical protein JWP87_3976 [Labilithrix sp.]|jgi:hypothetical protein|nr:hypothetical protein [Labilithrix sp.]
MISAQSSARRFHLFALAAAALVPAAIACGGQPEPITPTATTAPPSASAVAPATTAPAAGTTTTWKDMNKEQRVEFMKTVVLPKMKTELTAYDAKRFSGMSCGTCHGEGAKDGSFRMPNAKLMPHVPNDMGEFQKLMKDRPDAVKFMATKVVPQMAQLLGEEPFDPKTGKGFGCHECHSDK